MTRKSRFCDGTVSAYTGYIDVEARHLFVYFFESRNDPDTDDVIFWTNGGPGGSSAMGLFVELGPCRLVQDNATMSNPYSWNEVANIFFIDQPIGVGASYADFGETVGTTEEAAEDIAAFVAIFFEHFTKFKGRAFHMAGESYAGRYLPAFAAKIYDQNPKLEEQGLTPINLSSVIIGNGCTHRLHTIKSYYDMQCLPIAVPPVIDLPRCVNRFTAACIDTFDHIDCQSAFQFCHEAIRVPFLATGYNPFDLTKKCNGSVCYQITEDLAVYLNHSEILEDIGVDPEAGGYKTYSMQVGNDFQANLDMVFPTQYLLAALLERGIRTLLYVGSNDWTCNWVGIERMTLELEWSLSSEFAAQPLRDWKVNGTAAGMTRSAGPLTFATVYGAGHLVPYDRPGESLELIRRWLSNQEI
ncbi:serine carboxypeptidase [Panus rudis PR-1116 ss-1]|nr:serine carboxypeptidase [Panus rudis PR-1116 ss-1]